MRATTHLLRHALRTAAIVCLAYQAAAAGGRDTIRLSTLDLTKVRQGWGSAARDRSVDGHPLTIAGRTYAHGVGTHAKGRWFIDVGGRAARFHACAGVDDEVMSRPGGTVSFQVFGDGRLLWESPVMRAGMGAEIADIDVRGIRRIELRIGDGGDGIDYDHADWADAMLVMRNGTAKSWDPPAPKPYLLTPKPPLTPRINGPSVTAGRPGHPFLYRIPATGLRPMIFGAEGLPRGLVLDAETGIITGTTGDRGAHAVRLTARNGRGSASRTIRIVIGDTIALTPPLGWNSWNCFACDVDQRKVLRAARALVSSGLADHGWTYVNIDDCWSRMPDSQEAALGGALRDGGGAILPNAKFPDMKALCDSLHALGLKAGIYTSPGPLTCAGYAAAYGHEEADARQFADWGFDYLKYDWCSYGRIAKSRALEDLQKPYIAMREALNHTGRDILFSLCQYGMGDVWTWGERVGGNCWRTTGDIVDTWESVEEIGFSQDGKAPYAGPGHWNDPDMLVVGRVGWGPHLHATRLTPDEQYTHITLWSLLSAPLLIGCDLTSLDAFTLNLLTNDEVLAVNQDPLGRQARRISRNGSTEVWGRELEDGTRAVGLFNRGDTPAKVTVTWRELGIRGKRDVRDVWRNRIVGTREDAYSTTVPPHGAALVRIMNVPVRRNASPGGDARGR